MSERDHYPSGAPCWVETLQPDPHAAAHFYGQLLGWHFDAPTSMPGRLGGEYPDHGWLPGSGRRLSR